MTPALRQYADPVEFLQYEDPPELAVYEDPPELAQYAARGDLPMEYWPGEWKTKYDVMRACGDPRDWFRFWWRYNAYCEAWGNFLDARRRRRNMFSGFDWNQVLIIGPYGARKSTLMVYKAKLANDVGHACFSNASVLFGWGLGHVELYTAMGFCPKCSVFPIDESAASLSSRLGHGVAISTFNEMGLNTRKQNAQSMLCGAQDWNVAASVRAGCREVWRPLDSKSLQIERRKPLNERMLSAAGDPASDPDNFILAWDVWSDFPYNKQDLIDGEPDDKSFGPPDYTIVAEGEEVRNAFLLNDSFQLAHAGAATMTNRDDVKDFLTKYHEMLAKLGAGPEGVVPGAAAAALEERPKFSDQVFAQVLALRDEEWGRKFIKPKDIAERIGATPQKVNSVLGRTMQDVEYTSNGYRTAEVFGWIAKMEAAANDE